MRLVCTERAVGELSCEETVQRVHPVRPALHGEECCELPERLRRCVRRYNCSSSMRTERRVLCCTSLNSVGQSKAVARMRGG